jgi:signal transduction histidine kinase
MWNALITGMSELFHRTLSGTITLECVLAGGLWIISAESNQLESAILNLEVNPRDAMPAGAKLTIGRRMSFSTNRTRPLTPR